MGLSHSIQTQIGINAEYFHVYKMEGYPRDGVTDITIFGYVSEAARQQGSSCVYVFTTRMENGAPTQEEIYTYLKTLPEFSDAKDS